MFRLAWCQDNRSAGFRIVGEGKTLRIESRIPGADCNPYLAFAGSKIIKKYIYIFKKKIKNNK